VHPLLHGAFGSRSDEEIGKKDPLKTQDHLAFVTQRIHTYYWRDDLNCATATLKILAEWLEVSLSPQVLDAALGMHGAGEYGAQCGLVEGGLMFLGIYGRRQGLADAKLVSLCQAFARGFEKRFGSLLCRELRPEGFGAENPPHLCEALSCRALAYDIHFFQRLSKSVDS
jgi:C_GCAxxG_C_C family probable redox protein